MNRKLRRAVLFIAAAGVVAAVAFGPELSRLWTPKPRFTITFFDVGQGDSALVRDNRGDDILIDGGPGPGLAAKLGRYLPFGDDSLEKVVLTHPHADHADGLLEIFDHYRVEELVLTGVVYDSGGYEALLHAAKERKVPVRIVATSTSFDLGPLRFETLWPLENLEGARIANDSPGRGGGINDTSIVLRASCGSVKALFMGDASTAVEKSLLARDAVSSSTILKVGHHGSRYSTGRDFLAAVRPEYAVVSVGKNNRYGQPALQTELRLKESGAKVFRTDQAGDISFSSTDCQSGKITTEK